MRPTSVCHAGRDHHGAAAAIGGDRAGDTACCDGRRCRRRRRSAWSPWTPACSRRSAAPRRSADWRPRRCGQSAGILSPASTSTMSPGTISWVATRWRSPSRTTVASGAASAISARTDFSARASWTKPSSALRTTISQDDDRLVGQRGLARILQQPFDHRDDGGDQQDDHQEVLELLEQPLPPRRFRRALELVRSVLLQALLGLRRAQPARRVGAERRDHGFRRLRDGLSRRLGRRRGVGASGGRLRHGAFQRRLGF